MLEIICHQIKIILVISDKKQGKIKGYLVYFEYNYKKIRQYFTYPYEITWIDLYTNLKYGRQFEDQLHDLNMVYE